VQVELHTQSNLQTLVGYIVGHSHILPFVH
jgi:hypothetical protein